MTPELFVKQLDYIYFCSGLAFLLLAVLCHNLARENRGPLPWKWLGVFALLQGMDAWLKMLMHAVGSSQAGQILCMILAAGSFFCLMEFSRVGWRAITGKGPGRWVLACFGLVALGSLGGIPGQRLAIRLGLGLTSGMAAAGVFWRAAAAHPGGSRYLKAAGLGVALFGVAVGAMPPPAPYFPATLLNEEVFLQLSGIPVPLVRALLASWITVILWLGARQFGAQEMDHYTLKVRRRLTWSMIAALVLFTSLGWLVTQFLGNQAARETQTSTEHYLRQFYHFLDVEMEQTQSIASALARSPVMATALTTSEVLSRDAANGVLDRFGAAFGGTVCYLMNQRGITIASSNRHRPDSFVGKSYVFRPYFREAIKGGAGRYLALGLTSKERGYYASSPVQDPDGKIGGVVVVKRSIDRIESLLYRETLSFLVDPNGIIFLSSRPEMTLKGLWPLPPMAQEQLVESRQFGPGPFPAILAAKPEDESEIHWRDREFFALREAAPIEGWSIVVMGSLQRVKVYRLLGIGVAFFMSLTCMGLFLIWDTTLAAAAQLGASERVYRSLVEGAPDCVALFDQEGRFVTVNPNGLEALGRPEGDIVGRRLADLWPEEQRYLVKEAVRRTLTGEKTSFELEYHHPEAGDLVWRLILNPIRESGGGIPGFVGIVADITEHKQAEADLQYRLAFEALVTKISTEFINLSSSEIDTGINQALEGIGRFAGVDRAYVFQLHDEGRKISNTHEWCAPGIEAQQERLQGLELDQELPYFAQTMRKLEVFYVPRVEDLPEEAVAEKREFTYEGIQSLVVVPMVHRGSLIGFLGFDAVRGEMTWAEDSISLLKMVGDILVNALERQRAEEALHLDEARLEALVQLNQMQEASIKEIGTFALEEAVRLTRSQIGYLAFLDDAETTLTMYAWSQTALRECQIADKSLIYPVEGTGLWGEAVRQRQPVITNDYEEANPYKKGVPSGHVAIRRHMNIPVFEGARITAVAGVGNKAEPYDEADVRQLTLLMDGMWKLVQRKRAKEDLAAEKERLAVTLSSIGDAVIATDIAGQVKLMNHVAEELTGWRQEEALNRPVAEIFHVIEQETRRPCHNPVAKIIANGAGTGLANNTVLVSRDGRERMIAESGAPIIDQHEQVIGVVLVCRDITLKRKMEEELLKVEKLRSLGILAGGIAHDFNNILTAILGNISLAQMYAPEKDDLKDRLLEAERASLRARDLVQQLLTFAKGGAPVKQLASLHEIVEESAGFAIRGSQSRCEFNLPSDLWPVEVDEGQISQVVQNLVINASQAMPGGGVIGLTAANMFLREGNDLPLPPGRYIRLMIEDQGIGIPAEYLPRIFDPYFSTKQQGSGLGLATVYSIVKKHEGYITVASQSGGGTAFTIYLPASDKVLYPQRKPQVELYAGQGRILLMDDEEMVREVGRRMLQYLGYEVELAADGSEALERYQQARDRGEPFAVVVLDLTVPGGMGGQETMMRLLDLDPRVKSIVSSGYAEDDIMTNYQQNGFQGVVRKPYKIEDIGKELKRLLAARAEKAEAGDALKGQAVAGS